jgi:hypothetical protein
MELKISKEWCMKAAAAEGNESCEAGILHPEAPLNRFVIEHGILHDTQFGRHIAGTADSIAAEGPERFREYIFSLIAR